MDFFSIASGSSGNCICIGNGNHHLLIDAGISGKKIEEGMNQNNLTTRDCDGILITHEHADHVSGLGVLARRYGLPMYATQGSIAAIQGMKNLGNIDPALFHVIQPGQPFTVEELEVDPVHISHDAADPVAYVVSDGQKKVGVCTDLGTYDDNIVKHMSGLDALILEANHDVRMLEVGPYPYQLKMRILSDRGHLSNEKSGQLLSQLLHDDMKHILLGHLSKENNLAELAKQAVCLEVSLADNEYKGSDFPIEVASRSHATELIEV